MTGEQEGWDRLVYQHFWYPLFFPHTQREKVGVLFHVKDVLIYQQDKVGHEPPNLVINGLTVPTSELLVVLFGGHLNNKIIDNEKKNLTTCDTQVGKTDQHCGLV